MKTTTTTRRTRAVDVALITLLVLALQLAAAEAPAADLRLEVINDSLADSPRPDDLYTSDLRIGLELDRFHLTAGERMFTDRERGIRFDETHLSVTTGLGLIGGWSAEASLGILRAGHGLLGERVQNQLHRSIGNDEVHLPYVASSAHFATAGLTLQRPMAAIGRTTLSAEIDAQVIPRFRS